MTLFCVSRGHLGLLVLQYLVPLSAANVHEKCDLSGTKVKKFIANCNNIINYPGDSCISVLKSKPKSLVVLQG